LKKKQLSRVDRNDLGSRGVWGVVCETGRRNKKKQKQPKSHRKMGPSDQAKKYTRVDESNKWKENEDFKGARDNYAVMSRIRAAGMETEKRKEGSQKHGRLCQLSCAW